MASRYKRINDVNYDRAIVEIAEKAVSESKNNSLAAGDCTKIIELVIETGTFSRSEKKTLEYVYDEFNFSGKARDGFRKKIDSLFDKPVEKKASGKKTKSVSKKSSVKKRAKAVKKKTELEKMEHKEDVAELEEKVEDKLYSSEYQDYEEPVLPPLKEEETEKKSKSAGILAALAVLVVAFVFFFDNIKSFFTSEDPVKKIEQKKAEPDKEKLVEKERVSEKTETVVVTEKEKPAVDGEEYIIQPGDKLISISKKFYGNFSDWKIIYRANKDVIKNPTLIYPGHKIVIPKK